MNSTPKTIPEAVKQSPHALPWAASFIEALNVQLQVRFPTLRTLYGQGVITSTSIFAADTIEKLYSNSPLATEIGSEAIQVLDLVGTLGQLYGEGAELIHNLLYIATANRGLCVESSAQRSPRQVPEAPINRLLIKEPREVALRWIQSNQPLAGIYVYCFFMEFFNMKVAS